ncbi:Reverse transcriptase (RT) catalytic domain protein [Acididesulfobacillus acetoxydans]|uniref:Group II intron-encoded protein LtrA n=1 Tax=Acididesulfobacillus acetoxydans TaxID=1561005 RepID=A0A8S0X232_9FIRM|nr:group II intron reverse transcriptase/maturase [Acididesulfobacillus acetoxydans]CAA7603411.1 Reverse transcriptase (RT) catalytic domain protein [Acididesulfobacillus acetoxydans]CEJ06492.1 Group II intron-encoded protein LtrA [Acididesulfobacillus acetoxydans]
MKWHNLYGRLLSYQRLYEAWLKVKANQGAGGVDGISLSAFESKLEGNLQELLSDLKAKTYKPVPVLRRYIPKRNGKKRPLGLPSIRDKVVQQAVAGILQPLYETEFHAASVGFRPGKGAFNAFGRIIHLMEQGYVWVYDADIKGYFDCIDHRILLGIMKRRIADRSILDLIWQWLKAGVMEDGVRSFSKAGSPQGGVISPLLANIYLNELDWELNKAGVQFVRYADDFLVFAKNEEGVKHGEAIVQGVMRRLKLDLSAEKTKTLNLMEKRTANGRMIPELEYLGVAIQGWFRKRDGTWSMGLKCIPDAVKDFREAIKEQTPKTHTLSLDALVERVNPVILGKAAYWAQAAKAVQVYKSIRGQCRCSTALLGQQATKLDTYVRQRIRRCRLPQRGGSKTYRRTNMLSVIYTHERLIGAGLRYAERIIRDAATGLSLTDEEYLAIIRQRREKAALAKRQHKAGDTIYWAKRAAAYERAQERIHKFESK